MIEYRMAALGRLLQAKGYRRYTVHCYRVLGQASWQVEVYDDVGRVFELLGGPSARYDAVRRQIDELPARTPATPPD
jgi:hypothetical protein